MESYLETFMRGSLKTPVTSFVGFCLDLGVYTLVKNTVYYQAAMDIPVETPVTFLCKFL